MKIEDPSLVSAKKILIADDHELIRSSMRELLTKKFPGTTIFTAGSVPETIDFLKRQTIDLLILDIVMPGGSGFDIFQQLPKKAVPTRVLVLSGLDENEFSLNALRLGAHGCISKSVGINDILSAVQKVISGGRHYNETVRMRAIEFLTSPSEAFGHEALSKREYQVMTLLADGKPVKEIASELNLSPKTVFTYRTRIYQKMGIDSPSGITRYAMRHGLIQ